MKTLTSASIKFLAKRIPLMLMTSALVLSACGGETSGGGGSGDIGQASATANGSGDGIAQNRDNQTPAEELVCEGLKSDGVTSGLYGLCVAFCEAQDWADKDTPISEAELEILENSSPAGRLLANYNNKKQESDPQMPCLVIEDPEVEEPKPACTALPATTAWSLDTAQELIKVARAASIGNDAPDCWDLITELETPNDFVCSEDIGSGIQEEDTYLEILKSEINDDIAVSFRGSQSWGDWAGNAQTRAVDWQQIDHHAGSPATVYNIPRAVHRGFFCAYESVESELKEELLQLIEQTVEDRSTARVYFTGYSLGSALATLAALDRSDWLVDVLGYQRDNVVAYTFATPRAMKDSLLDNYYEDYVPNSWEVVSYWDPVPHLLSSRYTHTHRMAVLVSPVDRVGNDLPREEEKRARLDFGNGKKYNDCIWPGVPAKIRANKDPENPLDLLTADQHDISLNTARLNSIEEPGVPRISLDVDVGLMRMRWSGDIIGPCDRVALYRGNPFENGEFVLGLNTREWALQDLNGSQLTGVAKGPLYWIVYANEFDKILKAVKFEPQIPKLNLKRSALGFLQVNWAVGDEGRHDFVAVYDYNPSNGPIGGYLSKRLVFPDINDTWNTTTRWNTRGRWVAYVTQENRGSGAARILKQVRHR